MRIQVRPRSSEDDDWIAGITLERWGADNVVAHGTVYRPATLPGFIATLGDERVGLLTYTIEDDACEVVTIDSLREGIGVGTALIDAVTTAARDAGCRRIWLITTNDNLTALGFYQKRGFQLVALHRNALDVSRQLKPEIPQVGQRGIPIRDEIELEMPLDRDTS